MESTTCLSLPFLVPKTTTNLVTCSGSIPSLFLLLAVVRMKKQMKLKDTMADAETIAGRN